MEEPLTNTFYQKLYILFGIVMVVFVTYSIIQSTSIESDYEKAVLQAKEAARPAEIELVIISDSSCAGCFDITSVVSDIKSDNVLIKNEQQLELSAAQNLVEKYNIEKIPTVIVTGELEKTNLRNLQKEEDFLVFRQPTPPYTDAQTGNVLGLVSAMILEDSNCQECNNFSSIIGALKQSGITIISENVVQKDSVLGKTLIAKYGVSIAPTLILSQDISVYQSDIINAWDSIGTIETDGSYITRFISPPYLNLTTNKVRGMVSATFLVDGSCDDCYDPQLVHIPIFKRFGITFTKENILDIATTEGQAIVAKYKIEKVPTILLQNDVGVYSGLVNVWKDVGTVEADGSYVFRKVEFNNQPYKDLLLNKVIPKK